MNTWQRMFQPSQPAVAEDPLERLDMLQRAVNDLRRGEALPAPIAAWLVRGFARFLDHGGNLGECLGFRVRRGGRFHTVPSMDKLRRRDEWLCVLVREQSGGSLQHRCDIAAAFLKGKAPEPLPGFSGTLKRMIEELGQPIPGARRIRQIVEGISAFGFKRNH